MKFNLALLALSLVLVNVESKEPCENNLLCAEEKLTRVIDKLNEEDVVQIYGDMIKLEKVPIDADQVSQTETDPLLSRIDRFLRVHRVHINFPSDGSSADLFGRALGEKNVDFELKSLSQGASEGRSKLKKILIPILLALKLKAMIVLPIVITVIGLIGVKGLGAGLAALLISGALALKSLLTPPPPPPRVSYGIIKPHDIHHDHWHRSQEEISQPYRGWAPEYNEQFEGYQTYQGIP